MRRLDFVTCLISVMLGGVVGSLLMGGDAYAQRPRQPKVERERLSTSAKFQGFQRGLLHVVTKEGDQWLLKVEAKAEDVSYYAEAEPDWVQPGMFVQFSGRFNKKGKAVEPISSLRVLTPRESTQFGVVPEAGFGGGGVDELFTNPEEAKKDPFKGGRDDATAFQVVGKLTRLRRGEMTVFAGLTVEADLADDAKVSVDVADLRLLKPGDSVKVEGWYLPNRKGLGVVHRITARAAEPLTVPKKKVRTLPGQQPDVEKKPAKELPDDDSNPFQVED